jgi:hypothetical protein
VAPAIPPVVAPLDPLVPPLLVPPLLVPPLLVPPLFEPPLPAFALSFSDMLEQPSTTTAAKITTRILFRLRESASE